MEVDFQYRNMGPVTKTIVNGSKDHIIHSSKDGIYNILTLCMLLVVTMSRERGIDPHTCYKLQGYLEEHSQL